MTKRLSMLASLVLVAATLAYPHESRAAGVLGQVLMNRAKGQSLHTAALNVAAGAAAANATRGIISPVAQSIVQTKLEANLKHKQVSTADLVRAGFHAAATAK